MRHYPLFAIICLSLCHAAFAQNPFDVTAEEAAILAVIAQYFNNLRRAG